MKREDVLKLVSLAGPIQGRSGRFERWGRNEAKTCRIADRPDAGWVVARSIASRSGRGRPPQGDAFRWVRAAATLLGGSESRGGGKDLGTVEAAILLREDLNGEVLAKALLLVPGATVEGVAKAMGVRDETVAAFADLFFNVLDRRGDTAFIARTVEMETGACAGLDFQLASDPGRSLIGVGLLAGSLEDVLSVAGVASQGAGEAQLADLLRRSMLAEALRAMPGLRGDRKFLEHALRFVVGENVEKPPVDDGFLSLGDTLRDELSRASRAMQDEARNRLNSMQSS